MVTIERTTDPMQTHHPDNERIKRRYLIHLKETRGFSEHSLDQVAKAIVRYESYTRLQDFRSFNVERVKAFKEFLSVQDAVRTHERLSSGTIYSTLHALRSFFQWLSGQRRYKAGFQAGDWDYFNPANSTTSIAKAHRPSRAPTISQIRHVLKDMEGTSHVARRDRALVAFLIVTGARCSAFASGPEKAT
jgi:site-specific recombinase XerD